MPKTRFVSAAVTLALCLVPATASAAPEQLEISGVAYDRAGQPVLTANLLPDSSSATYSWWACAAGSADCHHVADQQVLMNGAEYAIGTVFEVRAELAGERYVARTETWRGTLHVARPPHVVGTPRVGRRVAARGGTWAGGWPGAAPHDLYVVACRTRTAKGCKTISLHGPNGDYPAVDGPVAIPKSYAGRYLFALEVRMGPRTVIGGVGYSSAAAVPVPTPGATVARSAPLGPIAPRVIKRRR